MTSNPFSTDSLLKRLLRQIDRSAEMGDPIRLKELPREQEDYLFDNGYVLHRRGKIRLSQKGIRASVIGSVK